MLGIFDLIKGHTAMSTGYICVLSCPKEPGSIALYSTEYRPQSAIKRLNNKLDATFELEYIVLVRNPSAVIKKVQQELDSVEHHVLDRKLVYGLSVDEATEIIQDITGEEGQDTHANPDFFQETILCESLQSVPIPQGNVRVSKINLASCEGSLVGIGRQGCPFALKQLAEVCEKNAKNSLKFRTYWREYLEMSLKKCEFYDCRPETLGCTRSEVARDTVHYLWVLVKHKWLENSDIRFTKSFLLAADKHVLREFIDILNNEWGMDQLREDFKMLDNEAVEA